MADVDLAGVPLFEGLSEAERATIAERMRTLDIPQGMSLIDEGDLAYKFYVILEGIVEVLHDGSHLALLGPGEFLGEHGILAHQRRGADAVALTPVRAAVAIGWDVREFMEQHPIVRRRILEADGNRSQTVAI